jgi:ribonuclease H / adenosylcobalamin/alpha-ribazole phosphatase
VRRFVVEADGGSRGNPGPAAYGTVVRDGETGAVLREIAEHIGTASNNVAEYRGLIAGLEAVRELDPAGVVEARLDSKLVVEQLSGRWKVKHPDMRVLALRAREILPPTQVTYTWVPRERNKHADRLANEALDAAARGQAWSPSDSTAELRSQHDATALEDADAEPALDTLVGWDIGLGNPTTTVLLRHGETAHTVAKRFSGSGGLDPELSAEGERQVAAVAARLAAAGGVDAVISSPLRRTRQTADAVAAGLGLEVREVDGFRECAFGEWDGLTFAEVREGWPELLGSWLGDATVRPPGGESFDDVRRRVRPARDQLLARFPERTVLVVTHVTPVKLLVREALGAPMTALYRMELSPATLTEIQWYAGGQASLRRFNDAANLL